MKFLNVERFTFRPIRIVMTLLASAILLLSSTFPAFAFGGTSSRPTDGTAQLNTIEKRSQDIAKAKVAPGSIEESQERAKGGINEVQGAADKDKMSRPSNSQDATTVTEQIGKALKKVAAD